MGTVMEQFLKSKRPQPSPSVYATSLKPTPPTNELALILIIAIYGELQHQPPLKFSGFLHVSPLFATKVYRYCRNSTSLDAISFSIVNICIEL